MHIQGDCILVLCHFLKEDGAIREEFAVRLKKAASIQSLEPELTIIINGGRTRGTSRSQGQAAYELLCSLGAPEQNVIWSEAGHDTFSELSLAWEIMQDRGWHEPIVITNWMQLMQVRVAFWRLGINWSPAETSLCDRSMRYALARLAAAVLAIFFPEVRGWLFNLLRYGRERVWVQKI